MPEQTHILGICLGMQLLGTDSQEGNEKGLDRIHAHFKRFDIAPPVRVPHMGWNRVHPVGNDPVFDLELPELRYYFTHSFHAVCEDQSVAIGRTHYGIDFTSAYRREKHQGCAVPSGEESSLWVLLAGSLGRTALLGNWAPSQSYS